MFVVLIIPTFLSYLIWMLVNFLKLCFDLVCWKVDMLYLVEETIMVFFESHTERSYCERRWLIRSHSLDCKPCWCFLDFVCFLRLAVRWWPEETGVEASIWRTLGTLGNYSYAGRQIRHLVTFLCQFRFWHWCAIVIH